MESWKSNKKLTFICRKVGIDQNIEIWGTKLGIDENVAIWLENNELNRILKFGEKKVGNRWKCWNLSINCEDSIKMSKFECKVENKTLTRRQKGGNWSEYWNLRKTLGIHENVVIWVLIVRIEMTKFEKLKIKQNSWHSYAKRWELIRILIFEENIGNKELNRILKFEKKKVGNRWKCCNLSEKLKIKQKNDFVCKKVGIDQNIEIWGKNWESMKMF